MDDTMLIANRIKNLRKEYGLTQVQLAETLNLKFGKSVHRETISVWENGKQSPEMDYLRCLASIFDVSINYIAGSTDDRHQKQTTYTTDEKAIISLYRALTDEQKNAAKVFMETFVNQNSLQKRTVS